MQDKFLSAIGLAKRAGRTVVGTEMVRDSAKRGASRLIIIASDASDNTKKEICDTAAFYNTEYIISKFTMNELSGALGLLRATSSVSITDDNLALLVKKSIVSKM